MGHGSGVWVVAGLLAGGMGLILGHCSFFLSTYG